MDWFDVGYKPEYDPAKIDKNVKILRNTVEKNNIKFTQELDLIDGKFEQTLSVDGAVSLFRQEARKFTFEADQINFEGHVFGENASFVGRLEGASFLSKLSDTNYTLIEDNSIHSEGNYWDDWGGAGNGNVNMYGIFDLDNGEFTLKSGQILSNGNRGAIDTTVGMNMFGFYVKQNDGQGTYIGNGGDIGFGGWYDSDDSRARILVMLNDLLIQANGSVSVNQTRFRSNGTIESLATYNNTSGNTVNMRVGDNGRFYRISSARKYKMDIQDADYDCKKVYNLRPRMWHDKPEYERNGKSTDGLDWYYGLVAEEVIEAGLPQFVEYSDGEPEAVAYERLPVAFIPILRDHEDKINKLLKRKKSHKRKIKRNKIKYRRSVSL